MLCTDYRAINQPTIVVSWSLFAKDFYPFMGQYEPNMFELHQLIKSLEQKCDMYQVKNFEEVLKDCLLQESEIDNS